MKSILENVHLSQMRRDDSRARVLQFSALLLKRALEQRLEEKGNLEWAEILRGWITCTRSRPCFRASALSCASSAGARPQAFMAAGVALPPTLREKV